jgi:CHASE2 domain-containing sensor protein
LIDLVGWAASSGARAVALDYFFERESQIDSTLCAVIAATRMRVLFGYGIEPFRGQLQALPVPGSLRSCVADQNSGHLVGLLDADRKARLLPLFFNGRQDRPALSLLAARTLAGETVVPVPASGQLRFIEPTVPHLEVSFAELRASAAARNALRDRLVFVGEESALDTFDTPFGQKPGAVVHADAVHSLTHSHYFRDVPWWVGFMLILASCYAIGAWCAAGASAKSLVIAATLALACFSATATIAAVTGPYWFDVFYPSAAVWLLLPLLLGLRRLLSASARGPEGPTPE